MNVNMTQKKARWNLGLFVDRKNIFEHLFSWQMKILYMNRVMRWWGEISLNVGKYFFLMMSNFPVKRRKIWKKIIDWIV